MANLKNVDDFMCSIQSDFTEEEQVAKLNELLTGKTIIYDEGEGVEKFVCTGLDKESYFLKGDDNIYPPEFCNYL